MSDDYYLNVLHDENNFKLIRKLSVDEYDKFNKASVFMQKLKCILKHIYKCSHLFIAIVGIACIIFQKQIFPQRFPYL